MTEPPICLGTRFLPEDSISFTPMSEERSGYDGRRDRDQWTSSDRRASRVFDVLSNERRRKALSYLVEHDASVDIDELVSQLASETDIDSREADWSRLELMFHHAHLPKMADAGLVEYDQETASVEKTEMANEMARRLELIADPQVS